MCCLVHIYITCAHCHRVLEDRTIKTVKPCPAGTRPLAPPVFPPHPVPPEHSGCSHYVLSNLPREWPCETGHFDESWSGQLDFVEPPQHASYQISSCKKCNDEPDDQVPHFPRPEEAANHIFIYDDIVQCMYSRLPSVSSKLDPSRLRNLMGDVKRGLARADTRRGLPEQMTRELVKFEKVAGEDMELLQKIKDDIIAYISIPIPFVCPDFVN